MSVYTHILQTFISDAINRFDGTNLDLRMLRHLYLDKNTKEDVFVLSACNIYSNDFMI